MVSISDRRVLALADETEKIAAGMPAVLGFESRDYRTLVTELPDYSLEAAEKNSETMERLLEKAALIPGGELDARDAMALERIVYFIKYLLFPVSPLMTDYYWLMFEVTPYHSPLFFVWDRLGCADVTTPEGAAQRLVLAAEYRRLCADVLKKLHGQAERGIYLFRYAVQPSADMLRGFADVPADEHPLSLSSSPCASGAQKSQAAQLIAEAEKLIAETADFLTSPDYLAKAPADPGWGQYPNGDRYYDFMREFHLGYKVSSEELNELGWRCLEESKQAQAEIRRKLGFYGSHAEFLEYLKANERAYPRSPEKLGEILNGVNDAIAAKMPDYFQRLSPWPCWAQRVDPIYEGSMTFGYFDVCERPDGNGSGTYYYNGRGLDGTKLQITAASLIAHELQPGHHYQESLIRTQPGMHPLFKRFGNTGYGDGWAEYAATLAKEMGVYDDIDEYGRLEGDKFLCIRLICDTGMNGLGYGIEKARRIMLDETYATHDMSVSETVRYSACIPGQCLPYKFGKLKFLELRDRYKAAMGKDYDIKKFHTLVLEPGNTPLPILEKYVSRVMEAQGSK